MMKYSYLYLIVFYFLVACERETTIDLPSSKSEIVIEATIETGEAPYVIVSKTSDYFDPITLTTLSNLFINDALVIISNGIITDTLKGTFKPIKGYVYESKKIIGVIGANYNLTVIANGKTLTANTTIIKPLPTDSVWFTLNDNSDTYGLLNVKITDPIETGNSYNYKIKRLNKDSEFLSRNNFVFDDQYINGKTLTNQFQRPLTQQEKDRKEPTNEEQKGRGFFAIGDTIVLKNSSIDRNSYTFWRNLTIQQQAANNPFGQPANVKGNVNGGLGAFTGYSVLYDTVIAK